MKRVMLILGISTLTVLSSCRCDLEDESERIEETDNRRKADKDLYLS